MDFAADLGGLFGAIKVICIGLLSVFNFYSGYQYLMAELFVERVMHGTLPGLSSGSKSKKKAPKMRL